MNISAPSSMLSCSTTNAGTRGLDLRFSFRRQCAQQIGEVELSVLLEDDAPKRFLEPNHLEDKCAVEDRDESEIRMQLIKRVEYVAIRLLQRESPDCQCQSKGVQFDLLHGDHALAERGNRLSICDLMIAGKEETCQPINNHGNPDTKRPLGPPRRFDIDDGHLITQSR